MVLARVFLIFFVCLASFSPSAEAYHIDNFVDYLEFCKSILEKYNIDYATLAQQVTDQTDNYKAWIVACIEALPDYGLGGPKNNDKFFEYIRWCLDNLSKIDSDYSGDVLKYVKFCIESIKELKMKIHEYFDEKVIGKGLVDYLEFCKQILQNYAGRAEKVDSEAYKNYIKFALRHLKDFGLDKESGSWGKEGYPAMFESLIKQCLELLLGGGYHQAWSQYLEACRAFLGKFQMKNYSFLFDGKLAPIISQFQEKLNEFFGKFGSHGIFKKAPRRGIFNAEGTVATNEAVAQTAGAQTSASSNSGSSTDQGLVIGLMVMVALSLVANIVIVAFLWKNRRASLDRM